MGETPKTALHRYGKFSKLRCTQSSFDFCSKAAENSLTLNKKTALGWDLFD
ncbi:MAG: hypothetical protein F6K65_00310 [Moorea sp. SIO3C2]|nr:hypothetical protein [Moorena sp. SIO3C2]